MKQLFSAVLYFLLIQFVSAQYFEVKDFREDPQDYAALRFERTDINDQKCAIIKVRSNIDGLQFDSNLGISEIEYKTGEVWLYVSPGERALKFMRTGIVTMDYNIPAGIRIEPSRVYILELVASMAEIPPAEIESQWLVITSEPDGADVYINDEPMGTTPYYNELPVGHYTWRLSASLYQPTAGVITLQAGDDKRLEIQEALKPDYGTLIIRSSPENVAAITINGFETGQKTPATIQKIKSGEVLISIRLNDYETTSRQVELAAGAELTLDIPMRPTFALVIIETDPASDIFINDQRRGSGRWEGRLGSGIYNFEARLNKHHPARERHQVNALENFTLNLSPQPITGNLRVIGNPHGAGIRIDGTGYGTTPTTIRNLLIGEYDVELSLSGHATVLNKIFIEENQTADLNVELPSGKEVTFTSEPTEAILFINDQRAGKTPLTKTLPFGKHLVKAVIDKQQKAEKFKISPDGVNNFHIVLPPKEFKVTFSSSPSHSTLFVNNKNVGRLPMSMWLSQGEYDIRVLKRNHVTLLESIQISEFNTSFDFELRKDERLLKHKRAKAFLWSGLTVGFGGMFLWLFETGIDQDGFEVNKSGYLLLGAAGFTIGLIGFAINI